MKKVKYEKPNSVDVGKIAAVEGADCLTGNTANVGCNTGAYAAATCNPVGTNPNYVGACYPGYIAASTCKTGTTAGDACLAGSNAQGGSSCNNGDYVA